MTTPLDDSGINDRLVKLCPLIDQTCFEFTAIRYFGAVNNKKVAKNRHPWHHRTTLSGYIFATKARIDNRKKIAIQQYLPHIHPYNGELRPSSGWYWFVSLGTPANFNFLATLLYGTLYTVSQKKGATLTMAITLSILDRFATFFHCCKEQ